MAWRKFAPNQQETVRCWYQQDVRRALRYSLLSACAKCANLYACTSMRPRDSNGNLNADANAADDDADDADVDATPHLILDFTHAH